MIMTRGKDDPEDLYNALEIKPIERVRRQFKTRNLTEIAIVVGIWLTGFDVPFLI